jgi:hypothetical protein
LKPTRQNTTYSDFGGAIISSRSHAPVWERLISSVRKFLIHRSAVMGLETALTHKRPKIVPMQSMERELQPIKLQWCDYSGAWVSSNIKY